MTPTAAVEVRARRLAALGDPARLSIVDELVCTDRSPAELGRLTGLASNLLAHHLDVLGGAGLVERVRSGGDGRRRYVRLVPSALDDLVPRARLAPRPALFVCSHNSARSQLAAALWRRLTGARADSAGTHPAAEVHPGAIAAARRAGLDLTRARPSLLRPGLAADLVVTVCDRAHEELDAPAGWLHWSVPDPVVDGSPDAFDRATTELAGRIGTVVEARP